MRDRVRHSVMKNSSDLMSAEGRCGKIITINEKTDSRIYIIPIYTSAVTDPVVLHRFNALLIHLLFKLKQSIQ
jgi:hypothetical protein